MNWTITYAKSAKQDLIDIYHYIAHVLLSPQYATNQTERIMKAIRSLEEMPLRYAVYKEYPWETMGLRFVPIDNYLVFYLPKEESKSINIIRIIYGGRDINQQLKDTTEEL
jgi:toxin ParE1/3/4